MKRSGGRRYYRPDDIDLLKGIRRLLYSEGYTIRGVQRILKEHGIKSVQNLADNSAAVSFGAIEEALGQSLMETEGDDLGVDLDEEGDGENGGGYKGADEDGIDFRFVEGEEEILETYRSGRGHDQHPIDRERLEGVLRDLIACRQMLDRVLKEG